MGKAIWGIYGTREISVDLKKALFLRKKCVRAYW
jgi:hypothetical protein